MCFQSCVLCVFEAAHITGRSFFHAAFGAWRNHCQGGHLQKLAIVKLGFSRLSPKPYVAWLGIAHVTKFQVQDGRNSIASKHACMLWSSPVSMVCDI